MQCKLKLWKNKSRKGNRKKEIKENKERSRKGVEKERKSPRQNVKEGKQIKKADERKMVKCKMKKKNKEDTEERSK